MNKSRALYDTRAFYRFSTVVMVLAVVSPLVAPVVAATATEGTELSKSGKVLPAWWADAEPSKEIEPGLHAALPGW